MADPVDVSGHEKVNILLVDDEPAGLVTLQAVLGDLHENLVTATSGREALRHVLASPFAVMIFDINMPEIDGYQLAALVRQRQEHLNTPIIFLTASQADDWQIMQGYEVGAVDFLFKPLNAPVLRSKVAVFVALAKQTQMIKRQSVALRQSERRFRETVAGASVPMMIHDSDGKILEMSKGWTESSGYTIEDTPTRDRWIECALAGSASDGEIFQEGGSVGGDPGRERVVRTRDGVRRVWEFFTTPVAPVDGTKQSFLSVAKDLTERLAFEERLRYLATHDPLTRIANRDLLCDRLKHAISRLSWQKRLVAVLFLDLDRFKRVNDMLGHRVGDHLLTAVAERLNGVLRGGDSIARLGGDEFALVLADIGNANDVAVVADKVLAALSKPFLMEQHELVITGSIGVSVCPSDGDNVETLLLNADTAMYQAKAQGRNNYQFYSASMNTAAQRRLDLEIALRKAITHQEFELVYQPILCLKSRQVTGMEALVRWYRPEVGRVAPLDFIPVAEETGLIVPLGEWILQAACRQVQAWRKAGWSAAHVAVNLSPRQFQQADLLASMLGIMEQEGTVPASLGIEITESAVFADTQGAKATLRALSGMGVEIALDDFGTGYSSLTYLKDLPITTLKIDQSFVRNIGDDPGAAAISSAIIALAHNLKLLVVAEGVELEEQRAFLQTKQCDRVQGYLFSKPLSVADATAFLKLN